MLRGCVPKKLLVYGAHVSKDIKSAEGYGWSFEGASHDWSELIKAKNHELDRLNKVYLGLLENVDIYNGFAILSNNNEVLVNDNLLKTKNILLAVGGKPYMPEIPGVELCINSDQALDLKKIPNKLFNVQIIIVLDN